MTTLAIAESVNDEVLRGISRAGRHDWPHAPTCWGEYRRARHLPDIIAVWPGWLTDMSAETTQKVVVELSECCERHRNKLVTRHWCYDLIAHQAALEALRAETALLDELNGQSAPMAAE